MRQYLFILLTVAIFAGCNSGKKENKEEDVKKDTSSTMPLIPIDENLKIDISSFGPLKLGQHVSETQTAIGPPGSKGKATEWAADGMVHENWSWYSYGLILNMSSDKTNKDATMTIFTITASSPCEFKTKAGMGIGNTYAEVEAAYKKDIDPEATDKTQITVGSVYGGIIFSFTNDKVSKVFLGAEAE